MNGHLFEEFARKALQQKENDIIDVYNEFIKNVPQEEKQFVSENFMLFIKCGENARLAPAPVQNIIKA